MYAASRSSENGINQTYLLGKGSRKKAIFEAGSQATAGLEAPFHSLLTVVELRLEAAGRALAAISHLASQLSFPFF